ncbi:MAG: hypothetical protein ACQ9MH_11600 [Nitrospinales bacterium]
MGFAPSARKPFPQPSALRLCRLGDPPQLAVATPILAGSRVAFEQPNSNKKGEEYDHILRATV